MSEPKKPSSQTPKQTGNHTQRTWLSPLNPDTPGSPPSVIRGLFPLNLRKQVLVSNASGSMSSSSNTHAQDPFSEDDDVHPLSSIPQHPASSGSASNDSDRHHALAAPADDPVEDHAPAGVSLLPDSPPHGQAADISLATPHRASSHDSEAAYHHIFEIRAAVNVELADAWVEERESLPFQSHLTATFADEYSDPSDAGIDAWLKTYDGYDSQAGRWAGIARGANETTIYDKIVDIMGDILHHFGHETEEENGVVIKRREVVNTHGTIMRHNPNDANADPLKSEPDISIFGTGPCATKETSIFTKRSYSQAASLWEIKTEETFKDEQKGQVGCYAREVFIQQPHRRFVYVTLMTSRSIRILRFDRAGCYYSRRINYHDKPTFFVKLVLLLSSFNEALLGYDTSISWVDGKRVMKMTPAEICNEGVWEPNTTELVFELDDQPMFSRRTIRSRGTVCWNAKYKGKQYIVKDYWRAEGRAQESAFLKDLAGIRGVGQMFTYDDDRESITEGRGFLDADLMESDTTPPKLVLNRSFTRVVLVKYGQTLEKAKSARQLLCAVRDIVQGHSDSLMHRMILHRDISFNNLLLSHHTASSHDPAGVVIDWDLAKKVEPNLESDGTDGDSRTGTRAYQSVKVLYGSPLLKHHDNMDDIESVFYVLYHVLYGYDTFGNSIPDKALGEIAVWHNPLTFPRTLSGNKRSFLRELNPQRLTRYSGPEKTILSAMVNELRRFFAARLDHIGLALAAEDPIPFPKYDQAGAKDQYHEFIAIIEVAIQKLPETPSATSAPPSPTGSASSGKRGRALDDEAELAASRFSPKRLRNRATESKPDYTQESGSDDERSPSPTDIYVPSTPRPRTSQTAGRGAVPKGRARGRGRVAGQGGRGS
ncbi:hypothetical protein DFH09DRAFT_1313284 [Mycena vulgaris]|nr:hypothetical protein DFH09DRAFT_1313284 [Mycena vulgaris]